MNTRTKGLLATMISAVFFGFIPLFVKTICAGGGNSVSAAFYRFFLSVPVLYIYLKAQGISMRITRTEFAENRADYDLWLRRNGSPAVLLL